MHLNEKAKALKWVNNQTEHGRDMIGHYIGHFIVPKIQRVTRNAILYKQKQSWAWHQLSKAQQDALIQTLKNKETTELNTNESNWIAVGSYAYEGIIAQAKREGQASHVFTDNNVEKVARKLYYFRYDGAQYNEKWTEYKQYWYNEARSLLYSLSLKSEVELRKEVEEKSFMQKRVQYAIFWAMIFYIVVYVILLILYPYNYNIAVYALFVGCLGAILGYSKKLRGWR